MNPVAPQPLPSDHLRGFLFDGEMLAGLAVTLRISPCRTRLVSDEVSPPVDCAVDGLRVSDRLANIPRFLYLPDGRVIETRENDAIDALLADRRAGRLPALIHWLEARAVVAAAAALLLAASLFASVRFGLPELARHAAHAVPRQIAEEMDATALNALVRGTTLEFSAREQVRRRFDTFVAAQGPLAVRPRLELRHLNGLPNAFAFPGGTILVSDKLVQMATEDELNAVFAHELGHIQLHHPAQGILRRSTALLLVSTLTGDLSALTTASRQLPFVLLQTGYSRELEAEADDYAIAALIRAGINPASLASILTELEAASPAKGSYLSTHPNTKDRVEKINRAARESGQRRP